MINNDILRQPNEHEKAMIDALKAAIIKSQLVYLSVVAIATFFVIMLPAIGVLFDFATLLWINITLWIAFALTFVGGLTVSIAKYLHALECAKNHISQLKQAASLCLCGRI